MSGPALARGRTGRRYVWPPNTENPELVVPSVTTILGQMDKPALRPWTAKMVAEFAVDNILAWETLPRDAAVDMLKRAPYRETQKAADKGTIVHNTIEAHLGNEPTVDLDENLLPYIAGALSFLEDHVAEVIQTEVTVFSREFRYAGTCDLIARLHSGRIAVCDWKTSRSGLYPEVALQLVAYAKGDFIGLDDGTSVDMPDIDMGIGVHLPGDGTYTARPIEFTERMWKTFVGLRSVQAWKDGPEADALGAPMKPAKEDTAA